VGIFEKQNDKEMAEETLKYDDVENSRAKRLFAMLPLDQKLNVINAEFSSQKYYHSCKYASEVEDGSAFTLTELRSFLETILKTKQVEAWPYVKAAFKAVQKKKGSAAGLNKAIQENGLVAGIIPVSKTVYSQLDNESKKILVRAGLTKPEDRPSYYRNYNHSENPKFELLFGSMSRQDLEDAHNGNFCYSQYAMYMAHAMTQQELYSCADRDTNFKHHNVVLLGYAYFRKYENNKKALKEMVGDRRKTANGNFFRAIEKIYQDAQPSIKFILDLEDEVQATP
jgi:hypothetical protein